MPPAERPSFVRAEIIDNDTSTHAVSLITDEGDEYFVIMDEKGMPRLYRRAQGIPNHHRRYRKRLGPPPGPSRYHRAFHRRNGCVPPAERF
jgi:hypothetical protein